MSTDSPGKGPRSRPVDKAYLRRAALAYLQRYASTAQNLQRVLARKAQRRLGEDEAPADLQLWITEVVAEATRIDLIDDQRFAEARIETLLRRGTSKRGLQARLAAKGIERSVAEAAVTAAEPDETASARRLAQRRRLGPWRVPPDPARRDRDMAVLMRAGFSYGVAQTALEAPEDEP